MPNDRRRAGVERSTARLRIDRIEVSSRVSYRFPGTRDRNFGHTQLRKRRNRDCTRNQRAMFIRIEKRKKEIDRKRAREHSTYRKFGCNASHRSLKIIRLVMIRVIAHGADRLRPSQTESDRVRPS